MEFKDISENISTRREIEQLREMLEEKDRHINDLTDTLTHFHVCLTLNNIYKQNFQFSFYRMINSVLSRTLLCIQPNKFPN